MNLKSVKYLLLIRLSSLGDVLLTTPLLRTVKNKYPDIKIDYLIRDEYADAVKYNPHLQNVYKLKRSQRNSELFTEMQKNNYDLIIDLQNNLRSRKIKALFKCAEVHYKKDNFSKFLLVNFKIKRRKSFYPVPVRYAETTLEINLDKKGLELILPYNAEIKLDSDKKYIGLCPGSRHFTKMWPADYFVDLGNRIKEEGYGVVVFGGKSDRKIAESISSQIENSINLCNDNNIFETAANMKYCQAVVCNDSGLMHAASAMNIPVVVMFGSSVKEFGFAPYGVSNLVLENNSLTCRPCSHIGKSECPKKHFNCMLELTPEKVFYELKKFLLTI